MKAKLEGLLPKSRFVRSVSVLAGGTAGAQLIVIAASPILTRLYTPEDFGLLAVYAGILGILGVIASLRYQLAIPLPESDKEAASIALLSLIIVATTTLCSVVAVWLLGEQLVGLLNTPDLAPYLWLIPIGLFLLGVYQVFQYWAIRTKSFSSIAKTRLTQSIGMTLTQIAGYSFGPVALLLGRIVGQSAGIFGLVKRAHKDNKNDFKTVTAETIKTSTVKYKKFPLVATWTGLASSAGMNLPPLLIAAFLGAGSAGFFSLAHRVLSQPMTVIGKSVSDAFYQRAVEAHREENLGPAVKDVYSALVRLALAPAITVFLVIPDIFIIVFGGSWEKAGDVARLMTPWLFFQFIVSPCTGIYPIIDRHDIALRFQMSLLVSSVVGAIVGGLYLSDLLSVVAIISILSGLVYLWRVTTTFNMIGEKRAVALTLIARSIPVSTLFNIPLFLIITVLERDLVWLTLGAVVSFVSWFVFLVMPMLQQNSYAGNKV